MSGVPREFRRICVFCGGQDGTDIRFLMMASALGRALALRGIDVVYGGGRIGLMGALADGALAVGGKVYGVIPHRLRDLEVGHTGLTELIEVESLHARKLMMAKLADAFITLPGGFGTLDELFEVVTWCQVGDHDKPVGILDPHGYYRKLLDFIDHGVEVGLIHPNYRPIIQYCQDLAPLLDMMAQVELPRFVAPPPRP